MHEVMRLAVILQRPGEPDRRKWPTARDGLNMATINGGRALRVGGLGLLQPGAPADFTLHDLDTPSWTPMNDPLMQLVFAASGATVDTVIGGGAVLVENRRITTFDAGPVVAAVRDLVPRLRARNQALQDWTLRLEELVE
jgi:cytosine/adenosine deaminase-related metal-dependent hydrolase